MNQQDALIYLPLKDGDDIEDIYEEKLFEYKQFFLSKVPSRKTFKGRLSKLHLLHEAFLVLSDDHIVTNKFSFPESTFERSTVLEDLRKYQELINTGKQAIMVSRNAEEIIHAVEYLCDVEFSYASVWYDEELLEKSLSKNVIDPVELVREAEAFEKIHGGTYEELFSLNEENILNQNAIRLSLYLKRESNE